MYKKFGKSGEENPADPEVQANSAETPASSEIVPSRKSHMSWLPWAILGAIIVALVVGILILRIKQQKDLAKAGKPPKVTPMVNVVTVKPITLQQTLEVTGNLRSNQDINLGSKISGRVAEVLVKEGDRVKRGQAVVQLDDKDLKAQVDQARAGVLTAQAHLKQAQANLPLTKAQVESTIVQAQSALQQAKAKLRQAQLNEPNQTTTLNSQLKNAQEAVNVAQSRLAQTQQTAKQTDQQTQSIVTSAKAGLDAAKANSSRAKAALDEVKRGARSQQIAQAQAQVNLAQAQLNNAKIELDRQKMLFEGGAAAKQSVDTAQTNYEVAKSQLEQQQQNLSLVREGATSEEVRQAEASYQQAQEGVRQAEATLTQAVSGRAQANVAQQDVVSAQAQLAQSKAALRTAQANLAQIPITKENTREAREQVESAQAALRQAEANRAQLPVAQQNVAVAQAEVKSAQAQLEQAEVNLGYARIVSPVDGVVTKKLTDAGETAAPGNALLEIVALNSVYFEAQISENSIASILDRQPVRVSIPSVSPKPLQGYVSEIIPVADPTSRQFRVRVTIPGSKQTLTPGSFARGVVTTKAVKNALVVPSKAVHEEAGKKFVYVVEGSGDDLKLATRPVTTGMEANDETQIVTGIQEGDRVVESQTNLEDGIKVQISELAL